ncbi:hypothetical protein J2751_001193 [Halorubrum alkaliphilum]|uniref:Uncharacterized protein n=1 Tax=Halorubrum alkaliphilum TaxID=261290 RepID=A0A8T4GEM4_9EURY|nr:hypothetical protein [Halorubrum alkaliphilum]
MELLDRISPVVVGHVGESDSVDMGDVLVVLE